MGIIFDLDQTLVDSSSAENLRAVRNWQKTYQLIPQFKIYHGISEVLAFTHSHKITTAIVTTSPRTYCLKVLDHLQLKFDCIVAYHDASPKKPHPAPMLKALELLKLKNTQVISIGDRAVDIESSKAAGIKSVGCLWGCQEKQILQSSAPDYIADSPTDTIHVLKSFFKLK